jgi:hypothetical protein
MLLFLIEQRNAIVTPPRPKTGNGCNSCTPAQLAHAGIPAQLVHTHTSNLHGSRQFYNSFYNLQLLYNFTNEFCK